jgi:signal transduction histidine kinase
MARPTPRSLSRDISITSWALVWAFAITSSAAAYYVLAMQLEGATLNRVSHLTQEVARQSAYTLLAAETSPAVAERFEASFVGVKDVRYAMLLNAAGKRVASAGEFDEEVDLAALAGKQETTVIRNTFHDIRLGAPVFLKSEWNQGEERRPFGFVYVVAGKESARRLALNVSLANVAFVVLLGTVLLLWASRRTRRLTRPLEQLVVTMNAVGASGSTPARAEVRGAAECRAAATAFNALMDRLSAQQEELRAYAEHLESRVAQRTQELQEASIAAQSAARYKSEVMAAVTHEMKAPLYIIGIYAREASAELEMVGAETETTRRHLQNVISEAEELSNKISQILQVARLEKGAYEVKREWIDVETLCHRLAARLRLLAKTNRNELSYSIDGRPRIWCDPQILEQIVMTIGTNACKFTRGGRVQVAIAINTDALNITVSDTGAGIPAEILPIVFEEFRQGEMGEARSYAGTGLGLSIAKRYTELLGGSIEIHSEVDRGTRVTVRVPLHVPLSAVVPSASAANA